MPASSLAAIAVPLTVATVIPGRLLTDTDRNRHISTGRVLLNPVHQFALAELARTLVATGASRGVRRVVNGVRYHALFGACWKIHVDVLLVLTSRPDSQVPDLDNLWKPLQNALAIPKRTLRVDAKRGTQLYTLFENDRQVCRFEVNMVPCVSPTPAQDLAIVRVTAHPTPNLALFQRA